MKIETMRIGNKMLVMDGKNKIGYFDLITKAWRVYEEPGIKIPVRILTEVKPDTVLTNIGGKTYLVKTIDK